MLCEAEVRVGKDAVEAERLALTCETLGNVCKKIDNSRSILLHGQGLHTLAINESRKYTKPDSVLLRNRFSALDFLRGVCSSDQEESERLKLPTFYK